jgi:hypothetical protein
VLRLVDILRAMTEDRESVRDHVETVRYMLRIARTPSHGGDGTLFRRMDGAADRLRAVRPSLVLV